MYSIYDISGFRGEVGSNMTVYEFQKFLDNHLYLKRFFEEGYTTEINKVVADLRTFEVDVSEYSNFIDVKNLLLTMFGNCKEIAILSADAD